MTPIHQRRAAETALKSQYYRSSAPTSRRQTDRWGAVITELLHLKMTEEDTIVSALRFFNEVAKRQNTKRTREFLRFRKDAYMAALDDEAPG